MTPLSVRERFENLADGPLPVRIALLAYLAHLLCEGWIGSSEIFLGVALIGAGIALRRGQLRVPFDPLYLPLGLYVIASILSSIASSRPLEALTNSGEVFPFLALPLALSLYDRKKDYPRFTIGALATLAVFQASLGLVQYFLLGHDALERRITGTTAHVMTFSGILLPLSLLFLSVSASRVRRPLTVVAAFLSTFALVFTFTRGAWLGWLAGLTALVLLRRPRVLFYLLPVFLLAVTFSPLPLFSRLVSSFDFRQTSVLDRIRMAEAGGEMIRDHPLFGVGPANVKEVYPLYRKADAPRFRIPHLHNNPIQIWAERGLLAIVAYLALLVIYFRRAFERRRITEAAPWAEGGIAAACALAVAGLFEFNFGDTEVVLTMLAVWAVSLAVVGRGEADGAADPSGFQGG